MKKVLSLLGKIGRIAGYVLVIAITLAMAYIMFAPDQWPKPFYLVYKFPDPPVASASSSNTDAAKGGASQPEVQTPAPPAMLEIKPGQGIMIDTGSKIVNLVDPTGRRYLRVGIVLEFAPTDLKYYTMSEEERTAFLATFNEEVNLKLPVINDVIITMLASQTFELGIHSRGQGSAAQANPGNDKHPIA